MVAIQATPPSIDLDAPLVDPPPGVQSDFDNPPNGNATMNGIASLSLALTIIAFSVHAFGKIRTKLHIEDWVFHNLPHIRLSNYFYHRLLRSGWNLQVKDEAWHLFNIYITTTMYNVTMILLKAAILFQWARIFTPGKRNIFFWLCYSIAGVNAVFYLATILIDLLYCQPIQYHWDPTIPGGHCGNDDLLSPLSAAINVLLDLIILILPQRVIWRLNMSFRKKIGVSLVFLTGLLCIVSASIRLSFAVELLTGGDYAYDASFEVLLGSLEMTFAFLTFSLPGVPKSVVIMSQYTRSSLERVTHTSRGTWRGLFTTLTSRSKSDGNNTYRHAETDERGLLSVAKAHSSDGASSKQLEAASIPMQGLSREVQDNAILRTTRFNVSESFVSDDNALNYRGLVPSQHPWQPLSNKPQAR
ncbi:hypothetical protein ABKA04_003825 [Annulohypoxylon sp. FPYF3050]